ncbi:hypothetical protein FHS95_002746 [Sphingomonas naasensis]|uniref:Uncharacterized protein n=1 Tax=Sphingomonas naasensis TaxID=1344951 RepID=A0A4S1WJR0_9SPHN|nr:DUF6683 family protein [Sphingomonas naasensis]NIJ21054.1 hypothetical protein [Sphingomonas naasensis]TGX43431.1 hypothetical protein E5A74_09755 [Sphingomonas naasensis]
MRRFSMFAAAMLGIAGFAAPAAAQYVGTTTPLFPTIMVPMFPGGTTVPFSGQSSASGAARATARTAPAATTVVAGRPQVDSNATELATHFAPDARARMKASYLQSFDMFQKLQRKLALPDNDVANGISAYLAGNYMVLHGIEIEDAAFRKLVSQMRQALLQNRGFQQVPAAQKRKLYEQTAMVGMFMAMAQLSLKKTPQDPEILGNLRDSARANLALVLGARASDLRIDSEGMHL